MDFVPCTQLNASFCSVQSIKCQQRSAFPNNVELVGCLRYASILWLGWFWAFCKGVYQRQCWFDKQVELFVKVSFLSLNITYLFDVCSNILINEASLVCLIDQWDLEWTVIIITKFEMDVLTMSYIVRIMLPFIMACMTTGVSSSSESVSFSHVAMNL